MTLIKSRDGGQTTRSVASPCFVLRAAWNHAANQRFPD